MKTGFLAAVAQLAAERNLPKDTIIAVLESALSPAYKKEFFAPEQDVVVRVNRTSGAITVYLRRLVVEDVTVPLQEISLSEARQLREGAQIGDVVEEMGATQGDAGRIAIQVAKQVILQRLHEAECHAIYEEFANKEGSIAPGIIQFIEPGRGIYVGLGRTEAIFPPEEQVEGERYRVGQRFKFYLLAVRQGSRGPQVVVSRSHPGLLKRLFEMEVPEVRSGVVEIKAIAREPGRMSKVAVVAHQEGVDPVGCCVGPRGIRIQSIVIDLSGERIDVVEWNDSPAKLIANALNPAQVVNIELSEEERIANVVVLDRQLSLAIGKEGQNARLAAKLTGWRVNIKSVSAAEAEQIKQEVTLPAETEVSEGEEMSLGEQERQKELPAEMTKVDEVVEEKEEVAIFDIKEFTAVVEKSAERGREGVGLRFAEDVMPAKIDIEKKRSKNKRGLPEKDKAAKSGRKRVIYSEDDIEE